MQPPDRSKGLPLHRAGAMQPANGSHGLPLHQSRGKQDANGSHDFPLHGARGMQPLEGYQGLPLHPDRSMQPQGQSQGLHLHRAGDMQQPDQSRILPIHPAGGMQPQDEDWFLPVQPPRGTTQDNLMLQQMQISAETAMQEYQIQSQLGTQFGYFPAHPLLPTTSTSTTTQWQYPHGMMHNNQESLTRLLIEQIRNSQEDVYSETLQEKGAISDYYTANNECISTTVTTTEDHLESMSSIPERDNDFSTDYQSKYNRNWVGDYLTVNEESEWGSTIFRNMQIQQIEEATVVDGGDQSNATSQGRKSNENRAGNEDLSAQEEEIAEDDGNQDLTVEEIDEFLIREQIAAKEGNNADLNSLYTPYLGQQFDTEDDAKHFFYFYGILAGFKTTTVHVAKTTSQKRNNERTKVTVKCNRYGKPAKEKTAEQQEQEIEKNAGKKKGRKRNTNVIDKTNCQCVMVAKEENDKWVIIRLDLDHNHELSPGVLNGKKYMTEMEKELIKTLNANNIPTRQMVSIVSYLRGGPTALPVKKKDISNYRTKINREVKGTDMAKVLERFRIKKNEDPTFFFKFQLGEDSKMKNIFWRDGSCLKYYADFGDCVSFDTTYMTNRYRLPFAPFVGVTGHGQSCIFGCAFLHDETIATFKWVFEAFIESMGGKHPHTIITDQDQAMKAAIEEVMPNTRHRNCLFHIKNKCYSKNIKVFAAKDGLYEEFEDIVNNCVTEEEFEYLWTEMIRNQGLENNKYFMKMWEMRKRFIPVYYKTDFYPFLHSTARSEGMNARFKQNVGPTYSMISFVTEYEQIVQSIDRSENLEDIYSKQQRPKELVFGYTFERQAHELYNRNIYAKFQIQVKATATLAYKEIEEGKSFEVWQRANQEYKVHRIRKYIVLTDLTEGNEEFSCICGKFSKDGILCSHILKVVIEKEINSIPEKYILDRWRKKEMRIIPQPVDDSTAKTNALLSYNILSRRSAKMNSKAAKMKEATYYLLTEMDRIESHLDKILAPPTDAEKHSEETPQEQAADAGETQNEEDNTDYNEIQDPDAVQKKGRPEKPKRMKAIIEQEKEKMNKKKKKKASSENTGSPVKPKPKRMKKSTKKNNETEAPNSSRSKKK